MAEEAVATQTGTDPNTHVTINSVVNYIFGGLTLVMMVVAGLFMMVGGAIMADMMATWYPPMADFYAAGGFAIGMMLIILGVAFGLPQILAGSGLAKRAEWGRILGLIMAAFHILYGLTLFGGNFLALLNLGFGGYAFWSLLQPDVVELFRNEA